MILVQNRLPLLMVGLVMGVVLRDPAKFPFLTIASMLVGAGMVDLSDVKVQSASARRIWSGVASAFTSLYGGQLALLLTSAGLPLDSVVSKLIIWQTGTLIVLEVCLLGWFFYMVIERARRNRSEPGAGTEL